MDKKITIKKSSSISPSEALIQDAEKQVTVKDAGGRNIALSEPGVLSQFRLIEAVGAETAKNDTYMAMVLPLIYVTEIDGDPIAFPTSKIKLEALIQRLGNNGVNAVMIGVQSNFGQSDPAADKAAIKK